MYLKTKSMGEFKHGGNPVSAIGRLLRLLAAMLPTPD
jgi:hypothetical protein